jgi:hypothetical protein
LLLNRVNSLASALQREPFVSDRAEHRQTGGGLAMQVLLDAGRPLRTGAPLSREFVERMVQFFQRHADAVKGWRVAVVTTGEAGYGMAGCSN